MHNIYLYKDESGDTFDWDISIDMFAQIKVKDAESLREKLIANDVGRIDLKYLDDNNKANIEFFNIIIWDFNNIFFEWLIKKDPEKIKFIEIGDVNE